MELNFLQLKKKSFYIFYGRAPWHGGKIRYLIVKEEPFDYIIEFFSRESRLYTRKFPK